ncbi:MAG: hypothetical protein H6855_03510 [Rhodospirillales bacterium]|nr:hypothetical protein [Rhodospirillales bacterium]MCB9979590.1 hypothetical protein [Rhodospirillales bacterium]
MATSLRPLRERQHKKSSRHEGAKDAMKMIFIYLAILILGGYLSYEIYMDNTHLGLAIFVIILMLVTIINFLHQTLENTKVIKKQIDSDNDLLLTRIHNLHLLTDKNREKDDA